MNSLSWLIYIAGFVNPASVYLLISSAVLFLWGVVGILVNAVRLGNKTTKRESEWATIDASVASTKKSIRRSFIFAVIASFMFVAVPTERTFYMIAASEVAGSVATSEMGKEILNDLNQTIKFKLESYRKADLKEVKEVPETKETKATEAPPVEIPTTEKEIASMDKSSLDEAINHMGKLIEVAKKAKEIAQ